MCNYQALSQSCLGNQFLLQNDVKYKGANILSIGEKTPFFFLTFVLKSHYLIVIQDVITVL